MAFTRDLDNLIPIMTSNSAPSGYVASASSEYSSTYAAWKAFTNTGDDYWSTANGVATGTLGIQFPSAQIVNSYNILPYPTLLAYAPNTWTFQGSNDGSSWTTLDTQNGVSTWSADTIKRFIFNNTTAYTLYRINVTANNGAALLCIKELELCATGQYASLIPTMTSNTAPSGVASASSEYGTGYEAYRAFNGQDSSASNYWTTSAGNTTGWLKYQFPVAKIVRGYGIVPYNVDVSYSPGTWTFEGSNNNTDWTVLDTRTNVGGWFASTQQYFSISNTAAYTYYRINVTANKGATLLVIGELRLFGYGEPVHRWKLTENANDANGKDSSTFNPSDKGTQITLSNGNNTASFTVGELYWHTVRSTTSKSSGKWYFEVVNTSTIDSGGDAQVGIANASCVLDNAPFDTNHVGYLGYNGKLYGPGATSIDYGATWGTNDRIGIAVDVDNSKVTFYKNNVAQNEHTYSFSGPIFAAITSYYGQVVTLYTAESGLLYTPPTGFKAWGNYLNLTNNGSVTFSSDGASFNGSSQWLSGTISQTPQGALTLWISPSDTSTQDNIFGWCNSGTTDYRGLLARESSQSYIKGNETGVATSGPTYNSTNFPSNQFKFIGLTWDSSTLYFYGPDGTEYSVAKSSSCANTDFALGQIGAYTNYKYAGRAKDARHYDYKPTPSEISALVAAGPNPVPSTTVVRRNIRIPSLVLISAPASRGW